MCNSQPPWQKSWTGTFLIWRDRPRACCVQHWNFIKRNRYMNTQNNRFPMLIHKVLKHYSMISVWCVTTGRRLTVPMFLFLWDSKFKIVCYNSDIICAMITWFLIKLFPFLERISGNRIMSRGFCPPHSTALKPCNSFLFVVHIKGQVYSSKNFHKL